MTDYEEMWNRLKVLVNDYLNFAEMKYDNSSEKRIADRSYGRMTAYQTVIDLMDEMEEEDK